MDASISFLIFCVGTKRIPLFLTSFVAASNGWFARYSFSCDNSRGGLVTALSKLPVNEVLRKTDKAIALRMRKYCANILAYFFFALPGADFHNKHNSLAFRSL